MLAELVVGAYARQDGAQVAQRATKTGATVVADAHGRYTEPTFRDSVFGLALTATTTGAAAGNLNAAAAAASTQFAIWNPSGNQFAISILKVWVALISGTPPNGPMFHNFMLNGIPTITSVGTAYSMRAGGRAPTARYISSAAGAALTGGGALTVVKPMAFSTQGTAFAAAAEPGQSGVEVLDGDIVIPPGFGWVPCFSAAGTTLLNAYGVEWEEVPL